MFVTMTTTAFQAFREENRADMLDADEAVLASDPSVASARPLAVASLFNGLGGVIVGWHCFNSENSNWW